ncbi:hypothetical protein T08_1658 [Trichinella sp. T8]|nr:hypothetical protein T08_1658 [Trichinella sp. T8]
MLYLFSLFNIFSLSPCQILIRTVLLACVVRQHFGYRIPNSFYYVRSTMAEKNGCLPLFSCRLPPESVPIPALVVVVLLLL